MSQSSKEPGSITHKSTVKEYNNKIRIHVTITIKSSQRTSTGSATIKRCAKEFHNQVDLGNITIERTARDCRIQNDCKGVPQSEEMSGVKQLI